MVVLVVVPAAVEARPESLAPKTIVFRPMSNLLQGCRPKHNPGGRLQKQVNPKRENIIVVSRETEHTSKSEAM